MSDPYLYSVSNNVATFSINGPPYNLMSLEYIDRLEEQLPDVLADDSIRAMVFTAEKIDGDEAWRIGLVTELVALDQIKERAQALGEELASQPRLAVKGMLDVIVGHETKTLEESMADEMAAAAANRGSADSQEGMRAFAEKRKPVFNQRG